MDLPTFTNTDGRLSVIEGREDVDFAIERIYYLYDVPTTAARGAHGHRELQQLIVAVHGQVEVRLDDGYRQWSYLLDRPDRGLYIGPMLWRDLVNFSPGAVALVLASHHYDANDYYHDLGEFRAAARRLR